jgi:hypothetical protein
MRSQAERDQQTVTIASALALFLGVLALGLPGLAIVAWTGELSDATGSALFTANVLVAALASGWYLARHRRD